MGFRPLFYREIHAYLSYLIRFTVQELKSKGQLHSAQITEVEIIQEKSRESSRSLLGKHRGGTAQPAYDSNLMEFLNSVTGPQCKFLKETG
jgi:hypothetical protein